MACTTKIMTAVAALEHASPDLLVTVAEKACGVEGSSIYLEPGERLTLEDLLYAMMLESANDAAAAIACAVSGGIGEFAALMNETAEKIGLADTHFTNPHGLAKLTAYAMRKPSFRAIVSTYKRSIRLLHARMSVQMRKRIRPRIPKRIRRRTETCECCSITTSC